MLCPVNERSVAFRPWLLAGMLRPVFFALSIAAGVIAGDRSGSFWVGVLAFLVASDVGRVIRRLLRGRLVDAVYEALWPVAAVAYAWLFIDTLDLSKWACVFLAFLAAGLTKRILADVFLPPRGPRAERWLRVEEWGIPWVEDVIPGTATRKHDEP